MLAETFVDRLLGIRRIGGADLVIIPGSSVHGIGMASPLSVSGVTGYGVVLQTRPLRPGRVVRFSGAACVIESRPGAMRLEAGDRVSITDHHNGAEPQLH